MLNKIYSFLGLAKKAGKLIAGEEACERALKSEKVHLIIVSSDASDNTKKKFTDKSKYRDVEIRFFGEKELIGRYVGKEIRSVVAILEVGFANRLMEMIDGSNNEFGGGHIGKG
jgi:ribosomal protein L7Ae-like RNA K-turn-binding protein